MIVHVETSAEEQAIVKMTGSKTDISETSTMAAPPVAKEKLGARIGAHWKKWWWIHAITLIGGVLIIVLPVYVRSSLAWPR